MSINEILIVSAFILIIIDVFFVSDVFTHIAYIIIAFVIAKEINSLLLYQVLIGVLCWFCVVIFHYTIWRKIIEKINDKFIAPNKHDIGVETFIGQTGTIQEIEGKKFILINDEIHLFESDEKTKIGDKYTIKAVKSNKLII